LGTDGRYQALPADDRGWLWSAALQLWIGRWEGTYKHDPETWLRFYDQAGQLVLTGEEAAEQRLEAEHQRTETEHQRAEAEHLRAEAERTHAETERERADVAEAEVARLRAELARLREGRA
jgi:hypothetical protein